MNQTISQLWTGYWFGRPGVMSVAVIRIALGLSLLLTIALSCPANFQEFLATQDANLYHPWGILALVGKAIPPAGFFEFCRTMGYLFSVTLILGLLTRASLIGGLVCGLMSAELSESFQQSWSHGNNVTFLAMIAFLFVPAGDALSLDALFTNYSRRNRPFSSLGKDARFYFYGVLLAQFSVAMMFFNAGFWKLRRGGRYFGWVLSDNMRNLLIGNRLVLGDDIPPHIYFIVMNEWVYKGMAFGNMVCQLSPILSMFLIHKPKLRALCGIAFALEFLGLGIVMRIWVPQFLPLVVVFFDWDALFEWVKEQKTLPRTTYAAQAA